LENKQLGLHLSSDKPLSACSLYSSSLQDHFVVVSTNMWIDGE